MLIQQVDGIEPVLMGLVSQIGEREDAILIDDLRGIPPYRNAHFIFTFLFCRAYLWACGVFSKRPW